MIALKKTLIGMLVGTLLMFVGPAVADPLGRGEPVPDFSLTDSNGQALQLQDLRGKTLLVTFIYTRCPIPTLCPAMMSRMTRVRELIDEVPEGREKFEVLTITLDPERDTPEKLKAYASAHGVESSNWKFLTGSSEQIQELAGYFGVVFVEEDGGMIAHNLRTALIDAEGRLALVLSGTDWKTGELAASIREMLEH